MGALQATLERLHVSPTCTVPQFFIESAPDGTHGITRRISCGLCKVKSGDVSCLLRVVPLAPMSNVGYMIVMYPTLLMRLRHVMT